MARLQASRPRLVLSAILHSLWGTRHNGRVPLRVGIALIAVLVCLLTVPSSANAAGSCTITSTNISCLAELQKLLADSPPYDSTSTLGDTFSGIDGLVAGGDGASIADFYSAMETAGTAPDYITFIGTIGPVDAAAALSAVAFPVAVTLVTGVTTYYIIHVLWGGPQDTSASGAYSGIDIGTPTWQHSPHVCGTSDAGWSLQLPNDSGAYSSVPWVNHLGKPFGGYTSCAVTDPSTISECANNVQSNGWPEACAVQAGVYNALSTTGCHGEPGGNGNWGDGIWSLCYQTDLYVDNALNNAITSLQPQTSDPTLGGQGAVITAPAPSTVDWGRAKSEVGADSATGSYVDTQLAQASATTNPNWYYDGATTVIYQNYTLPSGDTETRIFCTDDTSGVDWTSGSDTTPQTVTRTGIGFLNGDGPNFECYLDANVDTSGTYTATADPAVSPNPVELTYGTAYGSPPDTSTQVNWGTAFNCPNVNIGTPDFSPLENINYGTAFPFGFLIWAKNGVAGWSGSSSAPSINIPLIGAGNGQHITADLSVLSGFMVTVREMILIVCTFGMIWFLATSLFGFKDWAVGEQGQLF